MERLRAIRVRLPDWPSVNSVAEHITTRWSNLYQPYFQDDYKIVEPDLNIASVTIWKHLGQKGGIASHTLPDCNPRSTNGASRIGRSGDKGSTRFYETFKTPFAPRSPCWTHGSGQTSIRRDGEFISGCQSGSRGCRDQQRPYLVSFNIVLSTPPIPTPTRGPIAYDPSHPAFSFRHSNQPGPEVQQRMLNNSISTSARFWNNLLLKSVCWFSITSLYDALS